MRPSPQTYSVDEVAAVLGISHGLVYALVVRDEFPIRHLRFGRRIKFVKADVERYLAGTGDQPPAEDAKR